MIALKKDEGIEVEMTSGEIDSYIEIRSLGDGTRAPLDFDDDGGGDTDARLRFVAPRDAEYVIVARSAAGDQGSYNFAVRSWTKPPDPVAYPLRPATKTQGEIAKDGPLLYNEIPYALYTLSGRKGQRILIDLKSSDFDPLLRVRKQDSSGRVTFTVTDDDGGKNNDARLFSILPEDGEYVVQAISISGEVGKYEIAYREYGDPPPRNPTPLPLNQELKGEITFSSATIERKGDLEGAETLFYEEYVYAGKAGEIVTVDLTSEDFDPMLQSGVGSPVGFAIVDANDDAPGLGRGSRVVLTFAEAGTVHLRAIATTERDKLGDFRIRAWPGRRGARVVGAREAKP